MFSRYQDLRTIVDLLLKLTMMGVFGLKKSSNFEVLERLSIKEEASVMHIDLELS